MPINPKNAKAALKIITAVSAMLAYGAIHRTEKKLSDKIDEHYTEPKSEETPLED